MPLPVSLLVLLHSLFPKLARPGGLNLMATYLQNTGRRSHSKGWADQPNVSHSLNVHLLPHRIHGTIVYWPTWTVDFLWSIRRYIYQSHESYGYLCEKTAAKCFFSDLIWFEHFHPFQDNQVQWGPAERSSPCQYLNPHTHQTSYEQWKKTVVKKRMKSYPVMVGTMSQTMKQVSRMPIKQPVWWKVRWSFHCSYHLVTHLWQQKKVPFGIRHPIQAYGEPNAGGCRVFRKCIGMPTEEMFSKNQSQILQVWDHTIKLS